MGSSKMSAQEAASGGAGRNCRDKPTKKERKKCRKERGLDDDELDDDEERGLDDDELDDDELRMLKVRAQESSKMSAQEAASGGAGRNCRDKPTKKERKKCRKERGLDDDELDDDELDARPARRLL